MKTDFSSSIRNFLFRLKSNPKVFYSIKDVNFFPNPFPFSSLLSFQPVSAVGEMGFYKHMILFIKSINLRLPFLSHFLRFLRLFCILFGFLVPGSLKSSNSLRFVDLDCSPLRRRMLVRLQTGLTSPFHYHINILLILLSRTLGVNHSSLHFCSSGLFLLHSLSVT